MTGGVYLDSSAFVKLVVREPQSDALVSWLEHRVTRLSSALLRTEVLRAVRPHGDDALLRARRLMAGLFLRAVDEPILDAAGIFDPPTLRSLDAIHLATAVALRHTIDQIVTYDGRMIDGARVLGLPVASPA